MQRYDGQESEKSKKPFVAQIKCHNMPKSIGSNWSLLGKGDVDIYNGYWMGFLSTKCFVDVKAMRYAMTNYTHVEYLDCQNYKLTDKLFDSAASISYENI